MSAKYTKGILGRLRTIAPARQRIAAGSDGGGEYGTFTISRSSCQISISRPEDLERFLNLQALQVATTECPVGIKTLRQSIPI